MLGTIEEYAGSSIASRQIDELDIEWWELDRRALRKTTRSGISLRILLPIGESLADGQVLFDDGSLVVLRVSPAEILVIRPGDARTMGIVCLALGNLHAPAEISGDEVLVAPDGPVEATLPELGIAFRREVRKFQPRRCAWMPQWRLSPTFEVRS